MANKVDSGSQMEFAILDNVSVPRKTHGTKAKTRAPIKPGTLAATLEARRAVAGVPPDKTLREFTRIFAKGYTSTAADVTWLFTMAIKYDFSLAAMCQYHGRWGAYAHNRRANLKLKLTAPKGKAANSTEEIAAWYQNMRKGTVASADAAEFGSAPSTPMPAKGTVKESFATAATKAYAAAPKPYEHRGVPGVVPVPAVEVEISIKSEGHARFYAIISDPAQIESVSRLLKTYF